MADLFRDTAIGQLLHWLSGSRFLPYPDEVEAHSHDKYLSRQNTIETDTLSRWTSTRNPNFADAEAPMRSRSMTGSLAREKTQASQDKEVKEVKELDDPNITIVTWDGPNDPANPRNWSTKKRVFVSGLICFLTFSIYIGSAIYTSGTEDVVHVFHVSPTVATLGLTLFVFGYGIGPMFLAPISEAPPVGRSPVYIFSLTLFVAFNFGVVYATNIGMLLAFRFLSGFIGSPVLATGGASMADMWPPKKRAYAIGTWGLFAVFGPSTGPLIGGFAVMAKGWTWTIWELIWLNGFCLVLLALTLPETSSTTILFRRAMRLRKARKDPNLRTEAEIEVKNIKIMDIVVMATLKPFQLTLFEPILLVTDVYLGLIYALLYSWFEAFPIAFVGVYGFNLGENGLAFMGIMIGTFVVYPPYFYWIYKVQEKQFDEAGNIVPEKRLPPAVIGCFLIPVSIFWFGWASRPSVHWIVPIIGSAFFPMGANLLFNAILNYQGDAYPDYVGSVFAGNDLVRSGMGGAFPLFAGTIFRHLGLGWGGSCLGFISIAFIPIPFVLWKFGRRIRMASKYARHDI